MSNYMNGFNSLSERMKPYAPVAENLILALWVVGVFTSTLTHELWRDEVRSLLLATGIDSFSEFISMAKYDGHPLLWRSILTAMYAVLPNPVVLQMGSLIIGFLTVWLFVKYSPFQLWIKALFIFGTVPFGSNAVSARDYGMTMLLFFLFAILITQKTARPIITGVVLFLAANTNSYGMYMSGLFLGYWIVTSGLHVLKDKRYIFACVLVVAGVLFSRYTTRVDVDTVFATPEFMAQIEYGKHFLAAILHPGEYIWYMLNLDLVYRDIFMVILILGLFVVRPMLGLTVLVCVVLFNFVSGAIIYPQIRHQGVLLGFLMTAYWLALYILNSERPTFKFATPVYYFALIAMFVPFMVHAIWHTKNALIEEALVDKSSAMAIGKYIETNEQLQRSIIIGEPDYTMQTIGYYSDNQIYLAREKRFGKFVKYSTEFQTLMTLSDLLDTAKELYQKRKVPVLIVIGYFGASEKNPKTFHSLYRGDFEMGVDDIREFNQQTLKLAEFNAAIGDENYQLFLYADDDILSRYQEAYMKLR